MNGVNKPNIEKYIKKYPLKDKARRMARDAVKNGLLVRKSCQVCGEKRVDGHHPDYSKPLEVLWLCKVHHNDIHHGRLLINLT